MNTNTTTTDTVGLSHVLEFAKMINRLPTDQRRAFELAFFNPTDAAIVCFESFLEADLIEELSELIDLAIFLKIANAYGLDRRLSVWMHTEATQ